jgi:hypothetical protein
MPKFDLNAYADKAKADPYVLEWGGKTYTVGSPPWGTIMQFSLEDAEGISEEDQDRFLSIFFGAEDYREIKASLPEDEKEATDLKGALFMSAMTYVGERMPESMVPKSMKLAMNGKTKAKAKA